MTAKFFFANAVQSLLGKRTSDPDTRDGDRIDGGTAEAWTAEAADPTVVDPAAEVSYAEDAEAGPTAVETGPEDTHTLAGTDAGTPALPESTMALVDMVLAAMEDLADVLQAETEAVVTPTRPIEAILARKSDAESRYRSLVAALQCEPGGIGALPAALRDRLTGAARTLAVVAQENIEVVSRARDAQQRMVDLIVDSVRRQREQDGGYGHLGKTASTPYTKPLPPPPAALDRSF